MSKLIIDFKGKVAANTDMVEFLRAFTPVKSKDDYYIPEPDREFDVKIVTENSVKFSRTEQIKSLEQEIEELKKRSSDEFNRRYKAEQKIRELEAKLAAVEVKK